jgi:predicted ferric reductase
MPTLRDLTRAGLWMGLYVLLALWPLLLLLAAPAPRGGGLADELGSALGFLAISLMAMQFLLTARFEWVAPPFGTDLVYAFHRHITVAVVVFALLHPVVLFGSSLGMAFGWLIPGAAPWEIASGIWATYALLALAIASWLRKRLTLPYEAWRWSHGPLAAAAVLLGIWHALLAGRLLSRPVVRWLWLAWTLGWVGLILKVRVFKPLALLRHPWTVREVRPEPGDSVTLVLEPEGHDGFRFRCGQFVWLTLGDSPFAAREHPFSIASSALGWPRVELTVKAIGDFTRGLLSVQPGERAYLDGPFGTMSVDSFPDADGYVFIAGGSGIVPCMSMLRTLADRGDRRPHLLVYGSSELPRTLFREPLEALSTRLDLRVVHVLERPPAGWRGEQGYLTQAMLDRWLPHRGRHAYFVCGPGPMMDLAEEALARLGVPLSDLHSERFDLV